MPNSHNSGYFPGDGTKLVSGAGDALTPVGFTVDPTALTATVTPGANATSWANLIPASPNPTIDQTAALQAALTGHQAQGWGCIDLQGCRVRVDGGITVNPLTTSVRNGILDFTHMTSGTALLVSTDANTSSIYGGVQHSLRDIEMIGAAGVDGLSFNSQKSDNILSTAWNVDGLSVHDFQRNIVFANHAYCTHLRAIKTFRGITSNIETVNGSADAGEEIHISDCTSFNSPGVGLNNLGNFEIRYSGSIDYNAGAQIVTGGGVEFVGHVEFTPSASVIPFQLIGASGGSQGHVVFSDMSSITFNGYTGNGVYVAPYAALTQYSTQRMILPAGTYGFGGTSGMMSGPGTVLRRTYTTVTQATAAGG